MTTVAALRSGTNRYHGAAWWFVAPALVANYFGQGALVLSDPAGRGRRIAGRRRGLAAVAATGKPWTQPIGFNHALFEVAADAG